MQGMGSMSLEPNPLVTGKKSGGWTFRPKKKVNLVSHYFIVLNCCAQSQKNTAYHCIETFCSLESIFGGSCEFSFLLLFFEGIRQNTSLKKDFAGKLQPLFPKLDIWESSLFLEYVKDSSLVSGQPTMPVLTGVQQDAGFSTQSQVIPQSTPTGTISFWTIGALIPAPIPIYSPTDLIKQSFQN